MMCQRLKKTRGEEVGVNRGEEMLLSMCVV